MNDNTCCEHSCLKNQRVLIPTASSFVALPEFMNAPRAVSLQSYEQMAENVNLWLRNSVSGEFYHQLLQQMIASER